MSQRVFTYKSKKAFLDANLSAEELEFFYRGAHQWAQTKMILLHRNCPAGIRERFVNSPIWYQRLTAMLTKHSWKQYKDQALKDPKSTVRAAALKRLYFEGELTDTQLIEVLRTDERIRNYFPNHIGEFTGE